MARLMCRSGADGQSVRRLLPWLLLPALACGESDPGVQAIQADSAPFGPGLFDTGAVVDGAGVGWPQDAGAPALDTAQPDAAVSIDAAADAAPSADAVGADAAVEPMADSEPISCAGQVGCDCAQDADCDSGLCAAQVDGSKVCAEVCTDACPGHQVCALPTEDATTKYCLPQHISLCDPCTSNSQCVHPGDAYAACVAWGPGKGNFCGTWCSKSVPCPAGFTCQQSDDVAGNGVVQCVPDAGAACACSQRAIKLQLSTWCGAGPCAGKRTCLAAGETGAPAGGGLTACSGAAPVAESCDGVDNDCDGATDEDTCDDGQPCTKDSCAPASGCQHLPMTSEGCDDGDACTQSDTCDDQGTCAGTAKACSDGIACTKDLCDPATGGCSYPPIANGDGCDDGDGCTVGDLCTGGKCVPGQAKACDDGNACTADSCDPANGQCKHPFTADGGKCNDGKPCTENDVCKAGQCTSGPAKICGGANPCVNSACDPATGLCSNKNPPDGEPCDDGNKCTAKTICLKGVCQGGVAATCDDGNPCTTDSCEKIAGCANKSLNAGAKCDDKDPCTTQSACVFVQAGVKCQGEADLCDDGKACTVDACDPKTAKCSHTAAKPGDKCSDGSLCTFADVCISVGGNLGCQGKDVPCDDSNPCSTDSCDKATGQCQHIAIKPGGKCDDGDLCTGPDVCTQLNGKGICKGAPKGCDDGDGCTADVCDKATGKCKHSPIAGCMPTKCKTTSDCSDGDACTKDLCILATGQCNWLPIAGCCQLYDKTYGNEAEAPVFATSSEYLWDVAVSQANGSAYAAGYVHAGTGKGSYQGLVIRRGPDGKRIWARQLGSTKDSVSDYLRAAVPRSDGGTWAAGYTLGQGSKGSSDGWLVRLSASGAQLSSKVFGGSGSDAFYGAAPWGKDGLVVSGRRDVGGVSGADAWVMWLDGDGNPAGLKERTFGGTGSQYAWGPVFDAKTGRTLVAGYGSVTNLSNQGMIWSISAIGKMSSKSFGGAKSDLFYNIALLADGDVAAVGRTYPGSTAEGWVVKVSQTLDGAKSWTFGGSGSDYFYDIAQAPDGKLVTAGYSTTAGAGGYDGWSVSLDPNTGKQQSAHYFGGAASDYLYALAIDKGGKRLFAGRSYSKSGNGDTWQLKADSAGKTSCLAGCSSSSQCSDGNACTKDLCLAGKCLHLPASGATCGAASVCVSGVCKCAAWNLTYGNEKDLPKVATTAEYIYGISRAKSGTGTFAAGYVSDGASAGGYQGLIIRRDDLGKLMWAKHYGPLKSTKSDYLRDIVARTDGTAWAAGTTYNPASGTAPDGWLLRVSSTGAVLSDTKIGGTSSEVIYGAAAWSSDGVVLAGYRNAGAAGNEAWLVWRDKNGNAAGPKERSFGGTGSQYLQGVAWDPISGATVAAGYTYVSGKSNQGLLAIISGVGSVKSTVIGGTSADALYDVAILPAGQVWAVGYTSTAASGSRDGWLVRTNMTLSLPVAYKIGGSKSDTLYAATVTDGGRLIAAGYSDSGGQGLYDGWLIEVEPKTGKALWSRYYGGAKNDYFYAVDRGAAGGYVAGGRAYSYAPSVTDADTWQVAVGSTGLALCKLK